VTSHYGAHRIVPESALDYVRLYDLERYLFEDVRYRFHADGSLGAFDLFCVVIWKANRATKHMAARLLKQRHSTLEDACRDLTRAIHEAPDERSRFMVLVEPWGFRIPMASALLTVLYPGQFTVYDVRACDVLDNFHALNNRTKPETMWNGYIEFMDAVKKAAPPHLSLRDKDRYLWARAFAEQLERDIDRGFGGTDDTHA
jgi:hypothetical protein